MHLTNDAVVAFADDNADGAVVESQLVAALDGWDGSPGGTADKRDGTIEGTKDVASFPKLFHPIIIIIMVVIGS